MASRERIGDALTVHVLVEVTKLASHAADSSSFLRGRDFGNAKVHNVLGAHAVALGADSVADDSGETLVANASLGDLLGAGLGDARVHLGEDLADLGQVLAALHGDGEGVGAGDGVLLGHGRFLSARGVPPWLPLDNYIIQEQADKKDENDKPSLSGRFLSVNGSWYRSPTFLLPFADASLEFVLSVC